MLRTARSFAVPFALAAAAAAVNACHVLPAQSVLTAANGGVEAPPARTALRAADSVKVLRAARAAQASFERLRFYNLPRTAPPSDECIERIGRFCITPDDDSPPRPETDRVRAGRASLIAALGTAAAALPGDDWITGQRVRYLIEAGRRQ